MLTRAQQDMGAFLGVPPKHGRLVSFGFPCKHQPKRAPLEAPQATQSSWQRAMDKGPTTSVTSCPFLPPRAPLASRLASRSHPLPLTVPFQTTTPTLISRRHLRYLCPTGILLGVIDGPGKSKTNPNQHPFLTKPSLKKAIPMPVFPPGQPSKSPSPPGHVFKVAKPSSVIQGLVSLYRSRQPCHT